MTEELFGNALREHKYHEPFRPFVIELTNGEQLEIDDPDAFGFSGGAGGFINARGDILQFSCDEVRAIRALPQETHT